MAEFIWKMPPDGQHGLDLTLQYQTDVTAWWNGIEYRNATRPQPRLSVSFTDWRSDGEAEEMRRFFKTQMQKVGADDHFYVPLWTHGVESTGATPDGYYQNGNRIYPLLPVRLTPAVNRQIINASMTESRMTFNVNPGQYDLPSPAPALARGFELFDFTINIISGIDVVMEDGRHALDYGRANPDVFYPKKFITDILKFTIAPFSAEEITAFTDFFRRHQGMARAFLYPTDEFDFTAADVLASGDNTIEMEGVGAAELFDHRNPTPDPNNPDDGGYRSPNPLCGIAIWHNGAWLTNIVMGAESGRGGIQTSTLICAAPWPANIILTKDTKISMLYQARFGTDAMTVSYSTPEFATITTGIQTIPYQGNEQTDEPS